MLLAVLILILAVLLFGAAAVRGVLSGVAQFVAIVILGTVAWIAIEGHTRVVVGAGLVMLALLLGAIALERLTPPEKRAARMKAREAKREAKLAERLGVKKVNGEWRVK